MMHLDMLLCAALLTDIRKEALFQVHSSVPDRLGLVYEDAVTLRLRAIPPHSATSGEGLSPRLDCDAEPLVRYSVCVEHGPVALVDLVDADPQLGGQRLGQRRFRDPLEAGHSGRRCAPSGGTGPRASRRILRGEWVGRIVRFLAEDGEPEGVHHVRRCVEWPCWRVLSDEVLTGVRDWRTAHPRATFAEIEAAVEERLSGLRAQLLQDVALASAAAAWPDTHGPAPWWPGAAGRRCRVGGRTRGP